ncbi:MAG: ParB/RepB/Spo0J family partition protein [Solirubrobacterales bacterium]|nr:ParB/RepB/Spo0J family partition protein [Solirubrobacterales bacterium]
MDSKDEAGAEARLFMSKAEPRMELIHLRPEEIEVRHNPRRLADVAGIRRLATSIARLGLEQPLLVSREGSGYALVAGGRRLEAVRELGWEEVPCVVLGDDDPNLRRIRAGSENMARSAMTASEEASELAAYMDELGLSVEEAAEAVGISAETARERRLPLLELPKRVRSKVHTGEVGVDSAMRLVRIARRSPKLAREIAERLACGALERRAFCADPAAALAVVAAEEGEPEALCVPFSEGTRLEVAETARRVWAACDAEALDADTAEKLREARFGPANRLIEVTVTDVTAAQGAGALLSYRRGPATVDFLVDPAYGTEWLGEALSRARSLDDEEAPEREGVADGEAAEAERTRRKREAAQATADNELIGDGLALELDHQREVPRPVAELIAGLVVDAYGSQLAHGARLVRRRWWRREVKEMRSGAIRSVERPLEVDEARERLEEHLAKAETGAELIGRLAAHAVAAASCDQRALAPSARRRIVLPYGAEGTVAGRMAGALAELAGRVLPRRRYEALRSELALDEAKPLRDRRSARQIERSARKRTAEEAERRAAEEAERPWGSLLDREPKTAVGGSAEEASAEEASAEEASDGSP